MLVALLSLGFASFPCALAVTVACVFQWVRGKRSAIHPRSGESILTLFAALAAFGAFALLLVIPVYGVGASSAAFSADRQIAASTCHFRATMLAVNGPRVLISLLLPVAIALLPVALRRTEERFLVEAIAALVLSAFTIIGGFSIGMFYAPSAVSMTLAAVIGCAAVTASASRPPK